MLFSVLTLTIGNNQGMGDVEYGKIYDIYFPPSYLRLFDGPSCSIIDMWRIVGRDMENREMDIGTIIKPRPETQLKSDQLFNFYCCMRGQSMQWAPRAGASPTLSGPVAGDSSNPRSRQPHSRPAAPRSRSQVSGVTRVGELALNPRSPPRCPVAEPRSQLSHRGVQPRGASPKCGLLSRP